MTFANKTIWITGASSGIGEALALDFSKQNCNLVLSARRIEKLEEVKQQCQFPERVKILAFDLADIQNMKTIAAEAYALFGKVDVLLNNGGISQRSLIIDTDISVDKKLIDVDYLGTVALTKAVLPYFVANKSGHFVVVTSLMGKFGSPYRSGYCGAKHALHGFFDVLRMEHEKDAIKVTLVCPGFVNTKVSRNALVGDGSILNAQDDATENGLSVNEFAQKMIRAIQKEKQEVYIGKKEVLGVYIKRFFPNLLHKIAIKAKVR